MGQIDDYLLIAVGSAAGGCARYAVSGLIASHTSPAFPWGTLVVNVTGCFVMGLFMAVAFEKFQLDPRWRLLAAVGFCGGYTTFSSFAYEVARLAEGRDWLLAAADVVGSNVAALAALWGGQALARWLW